MVLGSMVKNPDYVIWLCESKWVQPTYSHLHTKLQHWEHCCTLLLLHKFSSFPPRLQPQGLEGVQSCRYERNAILTLLSEDMLTYLQMLL